MLIGKDWKIESDSLNVVLYRKHMATRKVTGERYEDWGDPIGYYSTIKGALHGLVGQGVRDTALTDLKTIESKISELRLLIDALPDALR